MTSAIVAVVILLATIVRTAFGFGEALIAVPLLALVVPVEVAAPLAVLVSIVVAATVLVQDWRHLELSSARRLLLSTILGIPLGLLLLKSVPESGVKGILALMILCFSTYSLSRRGRFGLPDDRFAWAFGFAAGVFGGAYGLNGPPLAVYGTLRGWSPEKFRATLQGYFLPASALGMCGYWLAGLWTPAVDRLFFWSVPSIIAGIAIGRHVSQRLHPRRFLRFVHAELCLIALLLLSQALS